MEQAVLEAFGEPPKPAVRAAHLRRMAEAVDQQVPAAYVARSRRRRLVLRGATVAFGLVLAGGSAMAATGTLPDPVQNALADAVDSVVDIPGGDSASGGNPKNPIAAANKAEAEEYTEAKKAYNACKKAEHVASKASPSPTPVESACGSKPVRQDFKDDKTPKPEKTEKPARTPKPERTENPSGSTGSQKPDKTPRPSKVPPGQAS